MGADWRAKLMVGRAHDSVRPVRRWIRFSLTGLAAGALLLSWEPARWLLGLASGQARLLWGARPIADPSVRAGLSPTELDRLDLVERIEGFGEEALGLRPTRNYERLHPTFQNEVWNVSACAPDRFESRRWWYPVVGSLPYTGFFGRGEAEDEVARLTALGWEAWLRPAGAYSTLGWFRDPLWRSMLAGSEGDIANLVLHELSHSTLWLRGEGAFNESFAQWVGDRGTERFLAAIEEERPGVSKQWAEREEDRARWTEELHHLAQRLDGLYGAALPATMIHAARLGILTEARDRIRDAPFHDARWGESAASLPEWNNARVVQFRLYHAGTDVLDEALARFEGDLRRFLAAAIPALHDAGDRAPLDVVAALRP